jgi:hypothetical protein
MQINMETIEINDALLTVVKKAITVALEYESETKGTRKLGITGEVGEVLFAGRWPLD